MPPAPPPDPLGNKRAGYEWMLYLVRDDLRDGPEVTTAEVREVFGASSDAVSNFLRRRVEDGHLKVRKSGRIGRYSPTPKGRAWVRLTHRNLLREDRSQ